MRSRLFLARLALHGVLGVLALGMFLPFYWMLATSLKSPQEAQEARPIWLPNRLQPANWLAAWRLGAQAGNPWWGGLGPGQSVEVRLWAPAGARPEAFVPTPPGVVFDPRAEGTRVEVAYREGAWVLRLTNLTQEAFRTLPLVVLVPKGVDYRLELAPDALRSAGEVWRLELTNAVPGLLGYVLHNYREAWLAAPFGRYFFNSFFTAGVQVGVGLFLAAVAAFALARIPFPGREGVFVLILATLMIPGEVLLIPSYVALARLDWIDTYPALIVPWLASAFGIFLLRQFFLSLPQELFDAARLDGAGYLGQLFRIALPLAVPGMLTYGIFTFLGAYNAFLWPLIVTNSPEMRTVQLGLQVFVGEAGSDYGALMAASTLSILPVVAGYFLAQKQFVQSIARSGIR